MSNNLFRDLSTYRQELVEGKLVVHLGQSGRVLTLEEVEEVRNDLRLSEIETIHYAAEGYLTLRWGSRGRTIHRGTRQCTFVDDLLDIWHVACRVLFRERR